MKIGISINIIATKIINIEVDWNANLLRNLNDFGYLIDKYLSTELIEIIHGLV